MGFTVEDFCPDCGIRTGPISEGEAPAALDRALRRRTVFKAPDEMAAVTVKRVLEADGIESWVEPNPIMSFDSGGSLDGYWGRVQVYEDQEPPALRAIEVYLTSLGPGPH